MDSEIKIRSLPGYRVGMPLSAMLSERKQFQLVASDESDCDDSMVDPDEEIELGLS